MNNIKRENLRDRMLRDQRPSALIEQWIEARPDTDIRGMLVTSRIIHLRQALEDVLSDCHESVGLRGWEFDVLATLRRQRPGVRLTHKGLSDLAMVSKSAISQRIDRLVDRGLVRRVENPDQRREVFVELTEQGYLLVERVIDEHASLCSEFISPLNDDEYEQLNGLLDKLLIRSEQAPGCSSNV